MELHQWIDRGLKKPGKKAAALARALGIGADKVSKMRKGGRRPQATELRIIEAYLGEKAPVRISDPVSAEGDEPSRRTVPLIGYVGASGAEDVVYWPAETQFDEVPAPESATDYTVAVEIRGSSLGAVFDRWVVFYDDVREPVTSDLIGRLCVLQTEDGRYLIKKLKQGNDGLFDLISNTEKPLKDVAVKWAARVKNMVPR